MLIGPKASVRASLALAILVTSVLIWIISSGVANYFNYLDVRSLHQEMVSRPDIYPHPIPNPSFGIMEFLTGRPPLPRDQRPEPPPGRPQPGPQYGPPPGPPGIPGGPQPGPRMGVPPPGAPGPRPYVPTPNPLEIKWLLLRLALALGLAAIAGAWVGRRFTKPLFQLAKGADAYQSGDFDYRIPSHGDNEFAAVAHAMNQMAHRVSEQISALEADAQRRKQFLADIAHELRSPVTTMGTMAGALQDGLADDPERREFAVTALVKTQERLQRLVRDLMELAKLDLTELPMNMARTDIRELASSAIRARETEARAAGINIHPIDPGAPVVANVDADRIFQVLDNIIENAISYAGAGSELTLTIRDANPIEIKISDTGRGILASDMPYVLDPFYRADAARTPGDCHSGLGLSIASRLVEAHEGTLTVTSEEGKGTTVTIIIPKSG